MICKRANSFIIDIYNLSYQLKSHDINRRSLPEIPVITGRLSRKAGEVDQLPRYEQKCVKVGVESRANKLTNLYTWPCKKKTEYINVF
jgi:hypothetical protein